MTSNTASAVIFVPVESPCSSTDRAESAEQKFRRWVNSLSVLDQDLLRTHALDFKPPERILDLFRYAPVPENAWSGDGLPRCFYPQPLLRALDVLR